MRESKKGKIVTIIALCVSLFGLTVAYATFRSSSELSGVATIKSNVWEVGIGSVKNIATTGHATFTQNPIVSNNSVTFSLDLKVPGDTATFEFDVLNTGEIDAMLQDLSLSGADAALSKNVTYTVTPKENVPTNKILQRTNGIHTFVVSVVYSSDVVAVETEDIPLSLGATINYIQN